MITASAFHPAWWLPGPHLQTIYPSLLRRRRHPELKRERFELPDGDFVDLDWTRNDGRALVLVLHGLEGSLESHYTGGRAPSETLECITSIHGNLLGF